MTSFVTLTKVYVIKCQENLAILAIEVFKLLIEKLRWLFSAISVIPASMLIYNLLNEWIKNIDLEKIIKLLVIWKNAVLSLTCSFFVQNVNFLTIYIKVTSFLWKIDQMALTPFFVSTIIQTYSFRFFRHHWYWRSERFVFSKHRFFIGLA